MDADIQHCASMIAEEKHRADTSPSREVAEMHQQMVMLYSDQLEHLRRMKPLERF